jgi:hypothetical protein
MATMIRHVSALVIAVLASGAALMAQDKVQGTFLVGGKDAGLKFVRAMRVPLDDKGKTGYAILLSAAKAEGDISEWRTAEPAKRGSFMYIMVEPNGAIWIAELGHAAAKTGRFGVVLELKAPKFQVQGNRLIAQFKTEREQSFNADRYTIDLNVEATLEK